MSRATSYEFYGSPFVEQVYACWAEKSLDESVLDSYFLQMPNSVFTYTARDVWYLNYHLFERNYIRYWFDAHTEEDYHYSWYLDKGKQQIKQYFRNAIDIAVKVSFDNIPQWMLMFDGVGMISADNFAEIISRTVGIVEKSRDIAVFAMENLEIEKVIT